MIKIEFNEKKNEEFGFFLTELAEKLQNNPDLLTKSD
jgi:hypothetical protein